MTNKRVRKYALIYISVSMLFVLSCVNYAFAKEEIVRLGEGALSEDLKVEEEKALEECEKFEELLRKKGALYEDQELEDYINEVGRRIAPLELESEAIKFQFKVISDPTLNAFALANGRIYLHTGLLARLGNEAQLASVLGHEISHVVNRDLVYFRKSHHGKTVVAKVMDLALTPVFCVTGILGSLGRMGLGALYASSTTGYGRNLEARADKEALEWMNEAGYKAQESVGVFETFLDEGERYKKGIEIYFLSSHPSNRRRKKKIEQLLDQSYNKSEDATVGKERFLSFTDKVRRYNAYLNIRLDRCQHALDNLRKASLEGFKDARLHFYMGEVYRRLAEDRRRLKFELSKKEWEKIKEQDEAEQKAEWKRKAFEEYQLAIDWDMNYADPHRGIAILSYEAEDKTKAIFHFKEYLRLNPNAKDKRRIKRYLEDISEL